MVRATLIRRLVPMVWTLLAVVGTAAGQVSPDGVVTQRTLLDKMNAYSNRHVQEKLFVHTDRKSYLTGETIWFKLYCVDDFFHRPLLLSKVAYVEVIDANQKAVLQAKVGLEEKGRGTGSLSLPVSLPSGNYLIRAYTRWMRNFSPDLYFHQTISVVNPFTPLATPAPATNPYDIQFFPEGGNLVNGLTAVVGFRAVDRRGLGIAFRGALIDERNDTVVRFTPLKFGIGRFSFTPAKGHVYRAVVSDASRKKYTVALPKAFDEGTVLRLSENADTIEIIVRVTGDASPSLVHLLAHTRQRILIYDSKTVRNGTALFSLNKASLGEGITHLTVFNETLVPLCERLYFKKPGEELRVGVTPESVLYGVRKKASVAIQTDLPGGKGTAGNFSISVMKADSLEATGSTIVNYLALSSDLKGSIESPGYYLERDDAPERAEAIDNLMLTHGWVRFKWEDILGPRKEMEFAPEYNGHLVAGRILQTNTRNPVRGVLAYLTSAGVFTRPYVSRSNDRGGILFEMQNFYGRNELIAQTNTTVDSLCKVEIANPFSEQALDYPFPELVIGNRSKDGIEQRSIHMQVENIFFKPAKNVFRKPAFDSVSFYGRPDEKYRLDDFTRFPTMEEVMREYVTGVQVRKNQDGFRFINFDWAYRTAFESNPFVMLDGVPVFDINKIIAFDPRQVKTIESLNRKYYFGVATFEGIVNYRTYRGDLGGFQLDPRSLMLSYEGLQLQREFFSPHYETPQQRESPLPDTRNLLQWLPTVTTDADGKAHVQFYTSDITGKFQIVVQGITDEGAAGFGTATFEVEMENN